MSPVAVPIGDDAYRDPFDRMLIAQAMAEDLMLVTAESDVQLYDVQCL